MAFPTAASGPARAPRPRVSIVIPVHPKSATLERCLEAIARLDPQPHETIVTIDGDSAELRRRALRHRVRVVAMEERCGPARARNYGATVATGDVVLFLDSDVLPAPDVVEQVAGYLAANPGVQAVIGSYDDQPAAPNFLSQYKNLLNHYMHQRARREGHTFWGACGAIRRDAFLALGGFSPRYARPSIEDIELGYRIRAAGGRVHVLPALQVTHLKRWTARNLLKTDVVHRAIPWSTLILRTGRMENDLNVDWSARAKVSLAYLSSALVLASPFVPPLAVALVPLVGVTLALDAPLWRFFVRKRGVWFATRAMAWHWFYYLYSGASLLAAIGLHLTRAVLGRQPDPQVPEPADVVLVVPEEGWGAGAAALDEGR